MTTVSRHFFGSSASESDHDLRVDIIENIEEDYGMFVWPCSIILAEYVWQQRSRFSGCKVVELGAGTSLPGLVAAKVGADVTLTVIAHNAEVLNNIRRICARNDASCIVLGLTWGDWDEPIFDLHADIILGADVLYDSANFDDLFATVTFLLENSPGGGVHNHISQPQWPPFDRVFDGQVGFEVFETAGWFLLPAAMQGCFTAGERSAC